MTRERRLTLETKEGSDATNGAPGIATRSKKLLGTKGIATRVEATSVVMFGSPT